MSDERPPALDHLWTGWRSEYVSAVPALDDYDASGPACVFCRLLGAGLPDHETLVLHRDDACAVLLNAYPYASGHALVMPVRHAAGLEDLTDDERDGLWDLWHRTAAAIRVAYGPEGMNLGMNLGRAGGAGIPGHLHAHVLPRWSGDTNFMTSVANARVLPEPLDATWTRLRDAWV